MVVQLRVQRGEVVELGRSPVAKLREEETREGQIDEYALVHGFSQHRAEELQLSQVIGPAPSHRRRVGVQGPVRSLGEQARLDRIKRLGDEVVEKILEQPAAVHAGFFHAVLVRELNAHDPLETTRRALVGVLASPRRLIAAEHRRAQRR